MGREFTYLSSHATNRYFIPNWGKDCYRFYTDIKRRKNESRTYFLDKMQEKLNEKMLRDEEMERMRR